MSIDWTMEYTQIVVEAAKHGVDPRFVRAIRQQEHGRPGRDFGVLNVSAPDYASQLKVCCVTVAHRSAQFDGTNPPLLEYEPGVGAYYTRTFIEYFGKIWAPPQADNDPGGLNANWIRNVAEIYQGLVKAS